VLAATEKELERIGREVTRRKRKPLPQAEIALKVGQMLNRFKVAKHFEVTIGDGLLHWRRRPDSIPREADLDGVYVVRTSENPSRCSAPDAVRRYKSLAQVERAFRCLKGVDLRIRPIHHRTADHVRAHILICMLAYYVEWHMRQALASLLFEDERLVRDRRRRDPVAPATPSASADRKRTERVTADGLPVHSFATLLAALSTRCRNLCSLPADPSAHTFRQLTEPTPLQARAFQLLGV